MCIRDRYKLGPIFEELTENMKNFTRKFQILKKNVTGNHNLFHFGQFAYSLRLYALPFFRQNFQKTNYHQGRIIFDTRKEIVSVNMECK